MDTPPRTNIWTVLVVASIFNFSTWRCDAFTGGIHRVLESHGAQKLFPLLSRGRLSPRSLLGVGDQINPTDSDTPPSSISGIQQPGGLPFERGVNRVILLGRIGQDPTVRHIQENDLIFAHFSLVTGSTYRHKVSNELIRRNQWHRVVVFDPFAISLCQNFLKKGSRVYIEGELCTRKYVDRHTGEARAITEVVLPKFNSVINLIQNPRHGERMPATDEDEFPGGDEEDDEEEDENDEEEMEEEEDSD